MIATPSTADDLSIFSDADSAASLIFSHVLNLARIATHPTPCLTCLTIKLLDHLPPGARDEVLRSINHHHHKAQESL